MFGLGRAARSGPVLAFLLVAAMATWCEAPHEEYENALKALSSKASRADPFILDVVLGLSLNPPDEAAAARLLAEGKTALDSLLKTRLADSTSLVLRSLRSLAELGSGLESLPPGGLGAESPFDAKLLRACEGSGAVLIVELDVFNSGAGGMSEATARLLETSSGRELSRDVIWTTTAEGGAGTGTVFVNGVRIR